MPDRPTEEALDSNDDRELEELEEMIANDVAQQQQHLAAASMESLDQPDPSTVYSTRRSKTFVYTTLCSILVFMVAIIYGGVNYIIRTGRRVDYTMHYACEPLSPAQKAAAFTAAPFILTFLADDECPEPRRPSPLSPTSDMATEFKATGYAYSHTFLTTGSFRNANLYVAHTVSPSNPNCLFLTLFRPHHEDYWKIRLVGKGDATAIDWNDGVKFGASGDGTKLFMVAGTFSGQVLYFLEVINDTTWQMHQANSNIATVTPFDDLHVMASHSGLLVYILNRQRIVQVLNLGGNGHSLYRQEVKDGSPLEPEFSLNHTDDQDGGISVQARAVRFDLFVTYKGQTSIAKGSTGPNNLKRSVPIKNLKGVARVDQVHRNHVVLFAYNPTLILVYIIKERVQTRLLAINPIKPIEGGLAFEGSHPVRVYLTTKQSSVLKPSILTYLVGVNRQIFRVKVDLGTETIKYEHLAELFGCTLEDYNVIAKQDNHVVHYYVKKAD